MSNFGITRDVQTSVTNGTTNPQPTNGDKIRIMSNEELIKFLFKVLSSGCFGEGVFPYHPCPSEMLSADSTEEKKTVCLKCGLDWLRKPAPFSRPHENDMSSRGYENIGEVSQ